MHWKALMADKKEIPTLTSIVHAGDDSMYNHFDDAELEEINATPLTENASLFENSEFENSAVENAELGEIPSITLDDDAAELSDNDFSTASLTDADNQAEENKTPSARPTESTSEKGDIKEKIDQAIADALPWIELNLKKQLYKKFDV